MRIDIINSSYTFLDDKATQKVAVNIQAQVQVPPYSSIRFEIFVDGQEFQDLMASGKSIREFTEEWVIKTLELDIVKVDSFEVEKYQRELEKKEKEIEALKNSLLELTLLISNGGNNE